TAAALLSPLPLHDALPILGCTFEQGDESLLRARGAIVFPQVPGTPVDSYRTRLYTPAELFDTPAYVDSLDARAYAWSRCRRGRRSEEHTSELQSRENLVCR